MDKKVFILTVAILTLGTILYGGIRISQRPVINEGLIFVEEARIEEILQQDFRCDAVAPIIYKRLPYLGELPLDLRKKVFIRVLLPSVLVAENKLKKERQKVIDILSKLSRKETITEQEVTFLNTIMKKYRTTNTEELLKRLHQTPVSVIIAQAALESGWGTSRFAVEGNNLFGIWTFKNQGIKAVSSKATLRRYNTLLEAVEDYLYNINVGWAYRGFRNTRQNTSNPFRLVSHLEGYSVLRHEYVRRLDALIRSNKLYRYDSCRLQSNNPFGWTPWD